MFSNSCLILATEFFKNSFWKIYLFLWVCFTFTYDVYHVLAQSPWILLLDPWSWGYMWL